MVKIYIKFYRCTCEHCVPQEKVENSKCCHEIPQLVALMEEVGGLQCVTDHPGFKAVCLDTWVLRANYHTYRSRYRNTPNATLNE